MVELVVPSTHYRAFVKVKAKMERKGEKTYKLFSVFCPQVHTLFRRTTCCSQ